MPLFKIKKYIEPDGTSDLCEWYESLDPAGKSDFVVRLEFIANCNSPSDLIAAYCKPLEDGISEVRFKSRKVQQRPLGYFGPQRKDYTFLLPAIEKGGKFIPKDAIKRAKDRKEIVTSNPERSNEWIIRIIE